MCEQGRARSASVARWRPTVVLQHDAGHDAHAGKHQDEQHVPDVGAGQPGEGEHGGGAAAAALHGRKRGGVEGHAPGVELQQAGRAVCEAGAVRGGAGELHSCGT